LEEIEKLEARRLEIDNRLVAAEPETDEEGNEMEVDEENALTDAEKKALKAELRNIKKTLKEKQEQKEREVDALRSTLTEDQCKKLILDHLKQTLQVELNRYIGWQERQIVQVLENWWEKYRVTWEELSKEKITSEKQLVSYLDKLGYANH